MWAAQPIPSQRGDDRDGQARVAVPVRQSCESTPNALARSSADFPPFNTTASRSCLLPVRDPSESESVISYCISLQPNIPPGIHPGGIYRDVRWLETTKFYRGTSSDRAESNFSPKITIRKRRSGVLIDSPGAESLISCNRVKNSPWSGHKPRRMGRRLSIL